MKIIRFAPSLVLLLVLSSCDKQVDDPDNGGAGAAEISLSATTLDFDEDVPEKNVFTVTSNKAWRATGSLSSLRFSPASGNSGTTEITVTEMSVGSGTITFTTVRSGVQDVAKSASITVTRKAEELADAPWPELPETLAESTDYMYITHYAETIVTKQNVRNYSACYDTRRHNPMWVAYPLHECYMEGRSQRTSPDPWRPDPMMELGEQSIIFGNDWEDWPWDGSGSTDRYQYWASLGSDYNLFTRGHLLRSAERGGAESELNIQTFYPTNIVPELLLYPNVHAELERLLPDSWMCADTIYVVAGCYYSDSPRWVTDASNYGQTSELSKDCAVPDALYKVYLRTKNGHTGKRIHECSADELMSIGFWQPQNIQNLPVEESSDVKAFVYSVDDIEKMIGGMFEFFPDAPDEVTASFSLSDWGL